MGERKIRCKIRNEEKEGKESGVLDKQKERREKKWREGRGGYSETNLLWRSRTRRKIRIKEPRRYGGAKLSPEEESVFRLTPRFSVYDEIDAKKCRVEIEKSLTKLRWQRISEKKTPAEFGNEDENSTTQSVSNNNFVSTVGNGSSLNGDTDGGFRGRPSNTVPDSIFDETSLTEDDTASRPSNNTRSKKRLRDSSNLVVSPDEPPDQTNHRSENERREHFVTTTSTVDLRNLKSTDLPTNSFVHMPPPLEETEEIKVQDLKQDLMKVTEEYIKETKSKKKRKKIQKYENLTEAEGKGLDKIMSREDVVVFPTDKSGRLAVDSKDNYIAATMQHVEEDEVIGEKEHDRLQKEINAHTIMWLRLSNAGEFTGGEGGSFSRIKNSLKVSNHGYAPLYTMRKDHKESENPTTGPPTRPVCGGSEAYNSKLSNLLGYFLRPVWQAKETSCISTEEMLASVDEVNRQGTIDEDCILGSLDVKALYPSLDVDFVAEKVGEMVYKSEIDFPCLNSKELGLYLAVNRKPEYLREKDS